MEGLQSAYERVAPGFLDSGFGQDGEVQKDTVFPAPLNRCGLAILPRDT